jgi:hypothetical protein
MPNIGVTDIQPNDLGIHHHHVTMVRQLDVQAKTLVQIR